MYDSELTVYDIPSRLLTVLFLLVLFGCKQVRGQESHIDTKADSLMYLLKETSVEEKNNKISPKYSKSYYDITTLSPEQLKKLTVKLDPETFRITQKAGTEPAFCGNLLDNKKGGIYCCVVCGLPLFSSEHKYDSNTGWPSFYRPFDPMHITRRQDNILGMIRTEILCVRCGSHLGHVFDDGPKPTGERYCLNSVALKFYEKGKTLPPESQPVKTEIAYFSGGCFWGIEHYFQLGEGVIDAISGYMQGNVENPTYKQVCSGTTGHVEAVKVVFDPKRITYNRLLKAFFTMHDPTELNRQGPDIGLQYRSGIWTSTEEQKQEAEAFIKTLEAEKKYGNKKIVTEVEPAKRFWEAEDYHQDYILKTGRFCSAKNPW